jgi:hypothetical protein
LHTHRSLARFLKTPDLVQGNCQYGSTSCALCQLLVCRKPHRPPAMRGMHANPTNPATPAIRGMPTNPAMRGKRIWSGDSARNGNCDSDPRWN